MAHKHIFATDTLFVYKGKNCLSLVFLFFSSCCCRHFFLPQMSFKLCIILVEMLIATKWLQMSEKKKERKKKERERGKEKDYLRPVICMFASLLGCKL